MTQEDKYLLLKELCARLQYGVKFMIDKMYLTEDMIKGGYDKRQELYGITCEGNVELLNMDYHMPVESIKPYLFPMSSMTEEQKTELNDTLIQLELKALNDEIEHHKVAEFEIDFYNKNMFDYRGLIPMGLAIDCTNLNIY